MSLMLEAVLAISGVLLYAVAAVLASVSLLRTETRRDHQALVLFVMGAFCLLGVMLIRLFRAGCIPSFTRFDAMACYALALSVVYLFVNTRRATRGIAGIFFPFITLVLLGGITALGMSSGAPPFQSPWLVFHVFAGYAAYAVFSLASVNAAAYLVQDYNLKNKCFGPVWERLPSLESLDHVMSRLVGLAFLLLTVSAVLGGFLVHRSGSNEPWLTDPKVAAVAAAWILFAVLVHMRASADRHGRGVAVLTVVGLIFVLFSFAGVHLVANTVHAFLKLGGGVAGP
jgi:ABC-type uncharacterized transport system permease subunit